MPLACCMAVYPSWEVMRTVVLSALSAPPLATTMASTAALREVHQSGEQYHEAELYRLQGELLRSAEGRKALLCHCVGGRSQSLPAPTQSRQASLRASHRRRSRGECGVRNAALAEECFQQALGIARRQQAKSWELRAAMSLSRLWQQQGKRQAARELLAAVYGWFTEGFDSSDLQEAHAQLVALQ